MIYPNMICPNCARLLLELADERARNERLKRELDLHGRAIDRALAAMHSTTRNEPDLSAEMRGALELDPE